MKLFFMSMMVLGKGGFLYILKEMCRIRMELSASSWRFRDRIFNDFKTGLRGIIWGLEVIMEEVIGVWICLNLLGYNREVFW
jgi:hypothetical protein